MQEMEPKRALLASRQVVFQLAGPAFLEAEQHLVEGSVSEPLQEEGLELPGEQK